MGGLFGPGSREGMRRATVMALSAVASLWSWRSNRLIVVELESNRFVVGVNFVG